MKTAYFDCFSGISGDMCLGALVDAGAPLSGIRRELRKLPLSGCRLQEKRTSRSGIASLKVDVVISPRAARITTWREARRLIGDSGLSDKVKDKTVKIMKGLFTAEAAVHGKSIDRVHLHELGNPDTVIDIVGSVAALELLGIEQVCSSPVNLGGTGAGGVSTAHGTIPLPAPATVELLKGVPVYSSGTPHELATPTGAAIIKGIASGFGPMPLMQISATGTGAGGKDIEGTANILRVIIGDTGVDSPARAAEGTFVIETNIDDMNPQIYGPLMEKLLGMGALDVYLNQVIMKKGRPGIVVSVLADAGKAEDIAEMLMRETTTLGVRMFSVTRRTLRRKIEQRNSTFGKVAFKNAWLGDEFIRSAPEFEDCLKIARKTGRPLIDVMDTLMSYNRRGKAD